MSNENQNIDNSQNQSIDNQTNDVMSAFDINPVETSDANGDTNLDDNNNSAGANVSGQEENLSELEIKYRGLQSKYDKLISSNEELVLQHNLALESKQVLNDLLNDEDEDFFDSFVYSRKPDLFSNRDIGTTIQETMAEEYGEYKPTRAEADDEPGGRAWLYFKRLDELYDANKSKKIPLTFENLKKQRAQEKEQNLKQSQKDMEKVKTTFNWGDNELSNFQEWANTLTVIDVAKMYNFASKTNRTPNLLNSNGQSTSASDRTNFLNSI